MQATLTLTGDVKSLTAVMAKLGGSGVAGEVAEVKRGRGRPKKDATPALDDDDLGLGAAEEEIEEAESVEDDGEEVSEEETEEESEEEETEPAPRKGATTTKSGKAAGKALSLDDDIIPAFQAFAKKFSREKAAKVLAKFKAKKVQEIPAKHYPEVLKLLKKAD